MRINSEAINLIKKWEGLYLHSYLDAVNVWTIGFGITSADKAITGTTIRKGMTIDKEIAEKWLIESLYEKYLPKVMKYDSKYHWNENEAGALVSFAFNIGSIDQLTAYGTRSKAMIADKMLLYCKADGRKLKGLLDRRKDERRLFLKPVKHGKYQGKLPTLPDRGYFKHGDGYLQHKEYKSDIIKAQNFLNWLIDSNLNPDGKYGDKTVDAVKTVQAKYSFPLNGSFGKNVLGLAKTVTK